MKIFGYEFNKEQPKAEVKEVKEKGMDIDLVDYNLPQAPPKKSSEYMREYKNWLFPNINAIANPVANIELKLMNFNGKDEVEEVEQHPALELLDRCNPYMTSLEVFITYVQHRKLTGEACWYIVRESENQEPQEIYPLRPDKITIEVGDLSKNEFIKNYIYRSGGKDIKIPPFNIVFFKDPDPENPYRGKGAVAAGATIIDIDNYSREWQLNSMYNGGATGSTFSTDQQLTDEQRKRLETELRKKYQGKNNANKVILLEGGLKLESKGANAKELDFNVSRDKVRDEISSIFNNPKTVLGISDDVNRANAEATEYVHNKNVIRVEMQKLADDLTEKFLPMFAGTENMFFTFTDPVQKDMAADVNKYNLLVNKVYTINEAREMEDLEPVEGGDIMYIPMAVTPLGEEKPEEVAPTKQLEVKNLLTKGQKLAIKHSKEIRRIKNKNVKQKVNEAKIKTALKKVLVKQITDTIMAKQIKEEKQIVAETKWTNKKKQESFEELVNKYDKKLQAALKNRWYPALMKETIGYLEGKKSLNKKSIEGYVFDDTPAITAQIKITTPIITAMASNAGTLGLEWIGSEETFVFTESLKKFIEANTLKLAKETTQTVKDTIKQTISRGITEGKGTAQIVRDIREDFKNLEQYQAERISRTEIARSGNQSLIEGWTQSGVVEGKEWILDGKPCEFCIAMKNDFKGGIPLGEPFYEKGSVIETTNSEGKEISMTLSYADTDGPPVHPNCMCTLNPIFTLNKRIQPLHKKISEEEAIDALLD